MLHGWSQAASAEKIPTELLNLSKDYPLGQTYFRNRLHAAFMANAQLQEESAIRRGIERAHFVRKGMLVLPDPKTTTSPNVLTYVSLLKQK